MISIEIPAKWWHIGQNFVLRSIGKSMGFLSIGMPVIRGQHLTYQFLPLDEAIAYRAVFVIVSGSHGWTDGNTFGAS